MVKNNRPTGGVTLHNIERARFLPPLKLLVELPLRVALSSNANKGLIIINLLASMVLLAPFLISS